MEKNNFYNLLHIESHGDHFRKLFFFFLRWSLCSSYKLLRFLVKMWHSLKEATVELLPSMSCNPRMMRLPLYSHVLICFPIQTCFKILKFYRIYSLFMMKNHPDDTWNVEAVINVG